VCLILAIVLCLSAAVIPALAANDTKNVKVKVQKVSNDTVPTELNPERQAAAEDTVQTQSAEGPVRVSIVVKGGSVLDKYSTNGLTANYAAANYRQQVRASQNAVAREISADVLGGKKLDVVWNLTLAANIISANVESDQIDAIRALPDVEAVVVEQRYYPDRSAEKLATQPNMATSSSMIGTNVAYETGYTGAGTRIAVIDTGIDTDHQSFDNGAFDYALQQEANGNENYIKSLDLLDQSKVTAGPSPLIGAALADAPATRRKLRREILFCSIIIPLFFAWYTLRSICSSSIRLADIVLQCTNRRKISSGIGHILQFFDKNDFSFEIILSDSLFIVNHLPAKDV